MALCLLIGPGTAAATAAMPQAPGTDVSSGLEIPGGSFEEAAIPALSGGWSASGPGSALTDSASARTGQYGARIASVSDTDPTILSSPEVKLKKASNVVYFRAMLRPVEGSPRVELHVRFTAANGTEINQQVARATALKTGAWAELSTTAAIPSDAKNVQVFVQVLGAGSVDVDDVSSDVRQRRELVPNGGAETLTAPAPAAPTGWTAASTQWEPLVVPNPSAEAGASTPENWKTFNYATTKAAMVWDTSVAHTGSKSLRIDGVPGSIGDWQQINYAPVTPGTYRFGFWVKGQNVAAGDIRPLVIFRNANGQTVGGDKIVQNTVTNSDWTYVESVLTAPTGAVSVRIDYRLYNGGTAWFDDVSIARQVTADGVAQGNTAGADSGTAKAGKNSLTLINQSEGDQSVLESAPFPVERLAGYDLSAAVKTALTGAKAIAGLKYLDANGRTLSEQLTGPVEGTTDWGSAKVQAFPPAAATDAKAFVRLAGKGQAWFDDISLMRSTVIDAAINPNIARPSLLLGAKDVNALKDRVKNGVVGDEYQRQLSLSDKWTTQQLTDPSYLVNPLRAQSNIYTVPAGATKMRLSAEFAGKGSMMVDGVSLTSLANNQPLTIPDNSFENFGSGTSGWAATSGTTDAVVTKTTEWAFADAASLQYAGASAASKASVALTQELPATPGGRYSLAATISQRGLIEGTGLVWTVSYTNDAGASVGAAYKAPAYNWDTHTRWDSPLFEATQASANVFLVTGNEEAAKKAILGLKYLVGESVWGMTYALTTGGKPNGEDGYGAVHFGRAMGGFAQALDLVINSKSMSETDRAWLTDRLGWMQDTQMNLAYYDRSTDAGRISNWNLDRAIGVGMVSMALPNLTSSSVYRGHAQGEVRWTLDNVVGDDGAFPETIRYHAAPLVRLVPFVQALKRAGGTDMVNDPKLKKMHSFLINVQTPVDSTNTAAPGTVLMPAIGDADYNEKPYRILGWNASLYKESDPELSATMQWTWQRAGSPVADTGANPWALPPLLNTDPGLPAKAPNLTSSAIESVGYDILRDKGGTADENYLIMSDTPRPLGHNHDDRTGFSLWGKSVPLALDSGTGGYFNGDNVWFNSAAAHNVVQFQTEGTWQGTAPTVTTPIRYYSDKVDVIQTGGATPGATDYQRNVIQLKGGFNSYLAWDRIKSAAPSRFNLHTLTTSVDQAPGKLTAHGYQGVDLDVHLLGAAQPTVTLDTGRVSGDWPQKNQQWIQLGQAAGTDHTVLMHPRAADAKAIETIEHRTGSATLKAFELVAANGERAMVFLNSGDSSVQTSLDVPGQWSPATAAESGSLNGTTANVAARQALVLLKTS
ncbi:carbohydrate binding domain-containing protein [Paenarthrobacter sp. FR1]|uniref:carbohydrate binding domain-containing protein n=1 Tax=Paenarthrobacter sp. FR1 TaxID=3439548 RepID=UPI003DA3D1FB